MDWFLYERDLRHERVNGDRILQINISKNLQIYVLMSQEFHQILKYHLQTKASMYTE